MIPKISLTEKTFYVKSIGFFSGIFLFVLLFFVLDFGPDYYNSKLVAAIATLMAVWWIFEAVPLAVTSLVPLILFPVFGIVSASDTAPQYMNSTIFLFVGGFVIAIAMEKWNLHKRIALNVILLFGKSPSKIILGFMVASGFISMWISNTATTLMLLPIGLSIIYKIQDEFGEEKSSNFSKALMISIAYSATIGGIATLVGTPPNLIFQRMYKINFPEAQVISFGEWMVLALPIAIIMMIIAWLVLVKLVFRSDKNLILDKEVIRSERDKLGKMTFEEKAVLVVFIVTSFLWVFRSDLDFGAFKIPGLSNVFTSAKFIDDSTVAVTMAFILFLIPCGSNDHKHNFVLNQDDIKKIPWDIVLLFGGGFALADGFVQSGLSKLIGQQFLILKSVHPIVLMSIISVVVVFSSELTSNSAQTTILLPLLASLSAEIGINPLVIMVPATLSVSLAFMLPVGTPPNAIVFSSHKLSVWDMVKAGFILNIIGIILVVIFFGYIY